MNMFLYFNNDTNLFIRGLLWYITIETVPTFYTGMNKFLSLCWGKTFYLSMSWILWLPLVVYIDDTLNISKLFLWWSIYDHAYLLSCFRFDGFDTFLSFLWVFCIILDIICSILSYICILTFVTKVGFVVYIYIYIYLNF